MSMVTTFSSRLMAMLAAGTFLLAPSRGNSAPDGLIEVPAALNPDKLSILQVISGRGVQVYTCARSPAGATRLAGSSRRRTRSCSTRRTGSSASIMPDRPGKISTVGQWSAP